MKKFISIIMFFFGMQINIVQAQCGYAMKFEPGDGGHVWSIDDYNMTDVTNNFTMEFWIKPNKTIVTGMTESNMGWAGLAGQNYAIFPGEHLADDDACGLAVSVGNNGVAVIDAAGNPNGRSAIILVHYTSISSTEWTHISIICEDRTPKLYINGVFAKSGLTSIASFVHPSAILGDVSSYGGYGYGPFNYGPTRAVIDEFKIWSVALSAATIANWYDKYTTSNHPFYSYLHTFWKFDEGAGDETSDITENSHTGEITYTTPPTWVTGWEPVGATAPAASSGPDENTYFGYEPDQCVSKTASITGGNGPFTYSWTLDRALLPGETMTGESTASVTVCLMDTAQLCLTVTDPASGCTTTDCANIFAEDVRCGNGNNQKTTICHNGNTICVDNSALPAHLDHGDNVGPCASFTSNEEIKIPVNTKTGFSINPIGNKELTKPGFNIYPNPAAGDFVISLNLKDDNSRERTIHIINSNGQVVKQLNMNGQSRMNMNIKEAGTYFVQLITGRQVITKKLVVVN